VGEENGKLRKSGGWEKQAPAQWHLRANTVATVGHDARVTRPQAGYSAPPVHRNGATLEFVNGYPVGASLLAMAVYQSILMATDLTLSRASSLPQWFGGVPGLFALVALAAARRKAIDPAPGADAVIATAALATVGGLEQRLRPGLVPKPQHSGTGLLRSTDGAVVAQEGIAVTPGNTALAPGTRLIGGKGRSAQGQQQNRDTGAK